MTQAKSIFLNVTRFTGHYIIWFGFIVSQLGLVFWIHQLAIYGALIYAQKANNPWLVRAVDMWSMVVLGILLLVSVFLTEAYLSKGLRQQRFWQRVGIVALIEAIIAALLWGLNLVL